MELHLVAFLGSFAWVLMHQQEPVYQGKRLSAWLADLDDSHPGLQYDQAKEAIRQIGRPAVPRIISVLKDRESSPKRKLLKWAREHHLIKSAYVPVSMENQHRAIHACEVLGVNAKPAIPALIALFNNGYTHHSSTDDIGDALSRIGPESITPLIGSLTNRDEMVRANVANYLGEWPTESPVVVPILVKCLEDKSRAVRNMAARSLGELAREPTIAIPGLVGVLDDEEKFVRYNACLAIGQFKTQAPFATAPLLKSLNDFDPEVRNMAAISLAIIDPENVSTVEKAMPFLIESLKGIQVFDPRDYRWRLKSSAIEALGKCGKPAAAAVPTLVKCLESKEPGIGKAAEKSLKAIDPEALAKAGVK